MSIEKRKSKDGSVKYRVRVYRNKKILREAILTRRIDAERWESEQKVTLEREKNLPSQVKDVLFSELYESWLKNHAEVKKTPSSVVKDKQVYKKYINPFIGSIKAHLIQPSDIDEIVNYLKGRKTLTNNSINKILQIVKTIFNYGIKKRFILYNPVTAVDFLPVQPHSFSYWNRNEVKDFLQYTNEKYTTNKTPYLIYLTAILTGMRAGELIALQWDCVDLNRRLITIRRSTDKTNKTIKDTTKGNKIRYVGISDELFPELVNHKNKNPKSCFVFENTEGRFMDYDNFKNRFFLRDQKLCSVRSIRFHDLRHTFASHYMMSGGNIYDLQKILGHSDVKTTMRYAHLAPDHIAHTANLLNFALSDKMGSSGNLITEVFSEHGRPMVAHKQ